MLKLFFILLVMFCFALICSVMCVIAEGFDIGFFRRSAKWVKPLAKRFYSFNLRIFGKPKA